MQSNGALERIHRPTDVINPKKVLNPQQFETTKNPIIINQPFPI